MIKKHKFLVTVLFKDGWYRPKFKSPYGRGHTIGCAFRTAGEAIQWARREWPKPPPKGPGMWVSPEFREDWTKWVVERRTFVLVDLRSYLDVVAAAELFVDRGRELQRVGESRTLTPQEPLVSAVDAYHGEQ